jgi:hypothetical protein
MVRRVIAAFAVFFFLACVALAADKEVTCKVIKVDVKKNTLTVTTADGRKVYTVSDDTKFIGPKGGVSEEGIKDDRLVPGAQIKLVIAGNNRTVREVHLPERKRGKDK